jgi:hypothetical protein
MKLTKGVRAWIASQARKGGKARWAGVEKAARTAHGRKAAAARWGKKREDLSGNPTGMIHWGVEK